MPHWPHHCHLNPGNAISTDNDATLTADKHVVSTADNHIASTADNHVISAGDNDVISTEVERSQTHPGFVGVEISPLHFVPVEMTEAGT